MKIALAQVHFFLGDFDQNCKHILDILKKAQNKADLLVFPEGGLWGYPPKDFLYSDKYFKIQEQKLKIIRKNLPPKLGLLLPAFIKNKDKIWNGCFLFEKNKKEKFFIKEFLPDRGVFFESRYFEKGQVKNNFFYWKTKKIQILICEDLWQNSFPWQADVLISVNSSPYTDQKQIHRLKKTRETAKKHQCLSIYLNRVGAQDSLIFDGGSFALNAKGHTIWQGKFFQPDFKILDVSRKKNKLGKWPYKKLFLSLQEQREQALILGIKDFFTQAGFSKAHLGLSGGIDSALVAYLAQKALGKNNVTAYFLPGPYTQNLSFKIIKQLQKQLKIKVIEKNLIPLFDMFCQWFFDKKSYSNPLTIQNIQARLRALVLMSIANESKSLLLATGNKSEMTTGYATLYGDLAGALCPIADLLKTEVYNLAHFINKKTKIFPKALFLREPSAELAPQQRDQEDLLPYDQLDPLLKSIFTGKEAKTSIEKDLIQRIQKQEFKRAQSPPILKLSEWDLGESWKRPIVHKFPI